MSVEALHDRALSVLRCRVGGGPVGRAVDPGSGGGCVDRRGCALFDQAGNERLDAMEKAEQVGVERAAPHVEVWIEETAARCRPALNRQMSTPPRCSHAAF